MKWFIPGAIVVLGLAVGGGAQSVALVETPASAPRPERPSAEQLFEGAWFARTELFFGASRPGGEVTEAEFQEFLEGYVKPRFPEGLTLMVGVGQFRGADGILVRERSRVLILLYRNEDRRASNTRIEEIRDEYKGRFQQESVLRADRCCEKVGF